MENKIEEAYRNYTETKEIFTENGIQMISPRGHYTRESIDEFKHRLLTDGEFNKTWSMGCIKPLNEK